MIEFAEYNNTFSDNSNSWTDLYFENCQNMSSALMPVTRIVGGVLLGPYMAVGLPANLWVMWLITHGTADSLAADFFYLNIALCDTLFTLAIPLHLFCVHGRAGTGRVVLTLLMELWVFVWIGRPLFQCCVCVERYLAVVHPVTFLRFKPLRFRVACSGLMWVVITCNLFGVWATDVGNITVPMTYFLAALSVIVCCCLSVLWTLKQPGPGETERTGGNNKKRRAFNIILVNLAIILFNYVPMLVVMCLKGVIITTLFYNLYVGFEYLLVLCGIFQPLFYLHKAGKLTCIFKQ